MEFDPRRRFFISCGYRIGGGGDVNDLFGALRMSMDAGIERLSIRFVLELLFPEFGQAEQRLISLRSAFVLKKFPGQSGEFFITNENRCRT